MSDANDRYAVLDRTVKKEMVLDREAPQPNLELFPRSADSRRRGECVAAHSEQLVDEPISVFRAIPGDVESDRVKVTHRGG